MALQSINPATEETLAEYPPLEPARAWALLEEAYDAAARWRATGFAERAALLRRAAEALRAGGGALRPPDHRRDGQADRRGRGRDREVRLELRLLRRARRALPGRRAGRAPTRARATSRSSRSASVLAIMPWNFPFWQVFRFAAPGADGRQHRACSSTPRTCRGCALAIEEVFRDSRLPGGRLPHAARAGRGRSRR